MHKPLEDRAAMRRCFKAWEICAFHLERITSAKCDDEALWAVLRDFEQDKFQRFLLWVDVVSAAKVYWHYEFECIRELT